MRYVTNERGELVYPSMARLERQGYRARAPEERPDVVVDADGFLQPASVFTEDELDHLTAYDEGVPND